MQSPATLPQESGAQKQLGAESFIIFDKVQVPTESTSPEADLPTSDKPESTPTKKGRRRHAKLSKKDALGILKSVAYQVQQSGMEVSAINLPNNSFGIVVRGGWICSKCGEFLLGMNGLGNVCEVCSGRSNSG